MVFTGFLSSAPAYFLNRLQCALTPFACSRRRVAYNQVTEQVKKLLQCIEDKEYSNAELMHQLDIKHRPTFLYNYLQEALDLKLIEMTIPDKPKSSKQIYRITEKGKKIKESWGK